MGQPAWAQHFGISETEMSECKKSIPPNEEPLRWFILSGRVPEADYLTWAMTTYELPKVKSDFFAIPPDTVFWEAVKREYHWSSTFLPLAEWNGVLLIGCLEPPQFHFRIPQEARFVLASAESLIERFNAYGPSDSSIGSDTAVTAITKTKPIQIILDEPTVSEPQRPKIQQPERVEQPVVKIPSDLFAARRELAQDQPDIPLPPKPEVSLKFPDGLAFHPPATSDKLMLVPDGVRIDAVDIPMPEPVHEKEPEAPEMPAGLEERTFSGAANIDFGLTNSKTMPMPEVTPEGGPEIRPEIRPIAMPVAMPNVEERPSHAQTAAPPPPPPPPPPQAKTQREEPELSELTGVGIQIPPELKRDLNTPPPTGAEVEAQPATAQLHSIVRNDAMIIPFDQCATYDELGASALARILLTYEHALILLFQGGQLRPWRWTELLHSVKGDQPDAIDLTEASIFRIVFRTCLPYHGNVVLNRVNQNFFNAFTRGMAPNQITITPVLVQKKVAGMMVGLSNQPVDFKKSLLTMEEITKEFGAGLDRIKSSKKAA